MAMKDVKPYKDPLGRTWRRYNVHFTSPDGTFGFWIWAISDYHAQLQLEALKETSVISGEAISIGMPDDPNT